MWEGLARLTEVPVVQLKRAKAQDPEGERSPETWGIGIEGAPSVVVIRDTEDGLDISVDWFSLSAKAVGTLEGDPAAYVAGTMGVGMTVGAVLGRSGAAAVAGAALGGLIGLLSKSRGRRQ